MQRLIVSLSFLVIVFIIGTYGYVKIENWDILDSFYMTLITLTTIGFREIKPLSKEGILFTIFLVIIGVTVFAYTVRIMAIILLEGQFMIFGRIKRMERQINKLKNHYIICGYGKNGRQLAKEFNLRNVPFVVIDIRMISELRNPLPEYVLYIEGDASSEEVLMKARIDKAKGLITVLPSDADNVFTTMTAKGLNKDIIIFAESTDPKDEKKLIQAGATRVIFPFLIASRKIVSSILKPNVVDFIDIALEGEDLSLEIEEIIVSQGSELVDKELKDSGIRQKFNIIIVAIKKEDGKIIFNPGPVSKILQGDTLIAMGDKIELNKLAEIARTDK